MRIFTDNTGELYVNAISETSDGRDVEGHLYYIQAGLNQSKIEFQLGPITETEVNGLTSESLLTILIHRTEYLDSKFGCDENKLAIQHMKDALINFELRTSKRISRGVEGKNLE